MPKGLIAYELLGVLLPPLPELQTPWRDMKAKQRRKYREELLRFVELGEPIYKPEGEFAVVTALRYSEEMSTVLWGWLGQHFFEKVDQVALLATPRTHDNILQFKRDTINAWGVEVYWEPDPSLVRELIRACPNTEIRWAASLPFKKPSVKIT